MYIIISKKITNKILSGLYYHNNIYENIGYINIIHICARIYIKKVHNSIYITNNKRRLFLWKQFFTHFSRHISYLLLSENDINILQRSIFHVNNF